MRSTRASRKVAGSDFAAFVSLFSISLEARFFIADAVERQRSNISAGCGTMRPNFRSMGAPGRICSLRRLMAHWHSVCSNGSGHQSG